MNDTRLTRLAEILIDHSCELQPGEKVLIEAYDLPDPTLVCALIELAVNRGGHPVVSWKNNRILRSLYRNGNETTLTTCASIEAFQMAKMDAYIGIRGTDNTSELSDVPPEQMELYQKVWWQPVHTQLRVRKTKWVVLRYPTPSMAQAAKMSTEAFEDFYFRVCTTDYEQMGRNQLPLIARMEAAKNVRLVAPGTDLTFSIEGIGVKPCAGRRNIPDGEVFTAPVRNSVQGTIKFNTQSLYQGNVFDNIELTFQDGKIVQARAGALTDRINQILDADEGARYIGEFSIACNNQIRKPMLDILFDEKIGGSLHFTPGSAYEEADNGNRSCVHWDLVLIQTPECGGGEIWFDDELVRKDGRFLPADLQPLNEGL